MINTVDYKNKKIVLIDQTKLPEKLILVKIKTWQQCYTAIKNMVVRGAPAIGVTGALGVTIASRPLCPAKAGHLPHFMGEKIYKNLRPIADKLISARPTAVNLRWGVERMMNIVKKNKKKNIKEIIQLLEKEGKLMIQEDIRVNKAIGKNGLKIFKQKKKYNVLTHCNAGALATVGYGTALGVIRSGWKAKKIKQVYADETRPRLQGGKLTAWELVKDKIPVTVISDNMAGHLMQQKKIDLVVVGADRIAANGDTANKIGTYSVAVLAKEHKIPFYVAAPISTIDPKTKNGKSIPIEDRDHKEITHIGNKRILAKGIKTINPAFDITPAKYITGIITEKGIFKPAQLQSGHQA